MTNDESRPRHQLGKQAVIIGLGLIGGSLAAALKHNDVYAEVVGVDIDSDVVAYALQKGLIDSGGTAVAAAVPQADLIVLATPVRHIITIIQQLGPLAKDGAIVMDVGGTKEQVISAMNTLPAHVQAIGGHPMCGKLTSGIDSADAGVFRDKVFVLTPTGRSSPALQTFVERLVLQIGGRPLILDAVHHDQLVALISHLPRMLPLALLDTAQNAGGNLAWVLAAGGFQDSTKKATDNIPMWLDVVLTNPHGIVAAIRALQEQLAQLAEQIETGDEATLRHKLELAAARWNNHFGPAVMDDSR